MKKVLIITYYWPPAGGPGVHRWLSFTKHLLELGYQPIVVVPKAPHYPLYDDSNLRMIPKNIETIEVPIFEPYAIAGKLSPQSTNKNKKGIIDPEDHQTYLQRSMLYVRGNYFIPDARKFWIKPVVKKLRKYLKDSPVNKMITTGPPHSVHLIGEKLKNEFPSMKWLADFRDPWTNISYHDQLKMKAAAKQKHQDLEKKVLNSADQLIVTSFQTQQEFQEKTDTPVELITNGYENWEKPDDLSLSDNFTLLHIGSLQKGRNPRVLWEVLKELADDDIKFNEFLEIQIIGSISNEINQSIKHYGLKKYTYFNKHISHQQSLEMQSSSMLLLLIEENAQLKSGIIPAKFFEYLYAKRPIVAIGPENWDVEKLIHETKSGQVFSYQDKTTLKKHISEAFKKYQKGKLNIKSKNLEQFSRKKLTKNLIKLLE